jgi:HK97 family phage major capsid protein
METKEVEVKLGGIESELKKFIDKHAEEVKASGVASAETKAALEKLGTDWKETSARLLAIEQKMTAPGGDGKKQSKSIGEMFIESDTFKAEAKSGKVGKVHVGDIKTAIVNATGQNQPLVQDYRVPGIIMPGLRRLTIRDLMPNLPVQSNLVQFTKENVFTNAAASQTGGSPNSGENVSKAESALTFTLANAPVQTVAHWIPASRQILDDAPALSGYINARLLFGLKLEEERQLLSGSGSGNDLSGLITNATVFDTTPVDTANDTYIDILRRAITQVQLSFFEPSAFILHPRDWEHIQLTKTTGTALNGQYIFSNPHVVEENKIWGLPVVPTVAMTQGQFMCGAFEMASALWDRQDATVEVSREHASFFIQNMVAILCEERIALTVFRPLSIIYGGFPFGS